MYYPCSENKAPISFAVTAQLICVFIFAYIKCWFSHDAVHLFVSLPYCLISFCFLSLFEIECNRDDK